jgi:hypothetical protein
VHERVAAELTDTIIPAFFFGPIDFLSMGPFCDNDFPPSTSRGFKLHNCQSNGAGERLIRQSCASNFCRYLNARPPIDPTRQVLVIYLRAMYNTAVQTKTDGA